jgi:hypothetical protein
MIDQLIKLVEQNSTETIVNNKEIPNEFNKDAIQDVAQQIFGGLKGQASQGNYQEVISMFQGNQSSIASNPMVSQMISNLAGSFASKFGISPQSAQSIVSSLLPQVMNQFVNKTNDPNDNDFDLQDMLKGLSGGRNIDLGDLMGKFSGDAKQSGGMADAIGKIFN